MKLAFFLRYTRLIFSIPFFFISIALNAVDPLNIIEDYEQEDFSYCVSNQAALGKKEVPVVYKIDKDNSCFVVLLPEMKKNFPKSKILLGEKVVLVHPPLEKNNNKQNVQFYVIDNDSKCGLISYTASRNSQVIVCLSDMFLFNKTFFTLEGKEDFELPEKEWKESLHVLTETKLLRVKETGPSFEFDYKTKTQKDASEFFPCVGAEFIEGIKFFVLSNTKEYGFMVKKKAERLDYIGFLFNTKSREILLEIPLLNQNHDFYVQSEFSALDDFLLVSNGKIGTKVFEINGESNEPFFSLQNPAIGFVGVTLGLLLLSEDKKPYVFREVVIKVILENSWKKFRAMRERC